LSLAQIGLLLEQKGELNLASDNLRRALDKFRKLEAKPFIAQATRDMQRITEKINKQKN
jgi:hypothetical protein